jgi:hypothetical protein
VLLNLEPHLDHAGGLGVLQQAPVPSWARKRRRVGAVWNAILQYGTRAPAEIRP